MATTRSTLDRISPHLEESLGVRETGVRPQLAPVPLAKDVGRRPAGRFGRLDIEQIVSDPAQPRTEFDPESLRLLADNLRAQGQLHPIHVRWSDELQKWVIISGERRWRAAQLAGLTTVECCFHEEPLTQAHVLELQLIENLLRADLRPLEQAKAFQSLQTLNGWTGKHVAEALHIPASQVSRALALLRLPADIQRRVNSGDIAPRTAYELSKLSNSATQRQLAEQAAAGHLSTGEAACAARKRSGKPKTAPRGTRQVFITEHGWKVTVTARQQGSYDEIEGALKLALEEVQFRIANGLRLF